MVTDAVNLILSNVIRKRYQVVVSPIHFREITDIPDAVERLQLQLLLGADLLKRKREEGVTTKHENCFLFPSSSLGTPSWVPKLELLPSYVPKLELGNEGKRS
ncbi:hypothetical protein FDQ92_05295 [Desulfoglaeba alkanexedens ALDC]|uniref:Uncharacterized protein n=1 Tax=Desulfoglaeba alkanexedens ALDC TaxID=980445 RepID=A0A4P8L1S1_9BACT|nr:hypothetical protein FDQ92_05295 [Desulfoglaeba alkanexedens ALDC]